MKKWLLVFIALLTLFILTAYLIIPDKLTISTIALVRANSRGAYRCLADESNWKKTFGKEISGNSFQSNDITFTINKKLVDGVEVMLTKNGISGLSLIEFVRLNNDSSVVRWTASVENNSNPFKKIKQYFAANTLKNGMQATLATIKKFLEKEENIYGIKVNLTTVKDTILIATKSTYKSYPSTDDIYGLIQTLQTYAQKNDARQSGYPMLNIKTADSGNFQAMIALPVNKELKDQGAILHKEMVAGNILVAEVKGGPYTVAKAFDNLHEYVTDHDLQSPAIPFQSLIIDRSQQPDTTKWVTKIYYPIY